MPDQQETFFIRRRNKVLGPFDLRQLERMRRRGQIGRVDDYSTDGRSWRKLAELQQLFVSTKPSPSARSSSVGSELTFDDEIATDDLPAQAPSSKGEAAWYYCSHEVEYGPFSESAIRRLIEDHQIRDGDLVWTSGLPDWKPAIEFFLFPVAQAGQFEQSSVPAAGNFMPAGGPPSMVMMQPNRGALILSLALLGVFVFGPLCLVAWILGVGDLSEMRRGVRDSRGRGATTAGVVIGIVGTILWGIGVAVLLYLAKSGISF